MTIIALYAFLSVSVEHKSSISRLSLVIFLVSILTLVFLTLYLSITNYDHRSINNYNFSSSGHQSIRLIDKASDEKSVLLVTKKIDLLNNCLVILLKEII